MSRGGPKSGAMLGVLLVLASCHFNPKRANVPEPPPHPRDHRADEPPSARERAIAEYDRAIDRARASGASATVDPTALSPGGLAGAGTGAALLVGAIVAGASRDAGSPAVPDEALRAR